MIGPEIPKKLLEKKQTERSEEDSVAGPAIPPELLAKRRQERSQQEETAFVGPAIPPQQQEEPPTHDDSDDPDAFAPALPPDLLEERRKQKERESAGGPRRRRAPVGPSMPRPYEEEEDDVVGPVLPTDYNPEQDSVRSAIADIEERARKSKEAMDAEKAGAGKQKIERDEWMLVPPEVDYLRNADSSRSRSFNPSNLTEKERDRSVWTDTPADRDRKRKDKRKQTEDQPLPPPKYSRHEEELRQNIQYHNMKERPKSLMELHKEQAKKNRKEVEDVKSRPFDREKDLLNAPRPMDRRRKDDMLKKARELGGRFGSGSSSFL
ncbi:hypothetical protein BJV82DRAFT_605918 [Fennellomyces sp. T-0311]|nr:hypothetical protein BJV82DRAFT_605918 [Fennellomyces sp. T-0311]